MSDRLSAAGSCLRAENSPQDTRMGDSPRSKSGITRFQHSRRGVMLASPRRRAWLETKISWHATDTCGVRLDARDRATWFVGSIGFVSILVLFRSAIDASRFLEEPAASGFHADRTAGGHCDYRDFDRPVASGGSSCPRSGSPYTVPEQSEAVGHRLPQLSRRVLDVSARSQHQPATGEVLCLRPNDALELH